MFHTVVYNAAAAGVNTVNLDFSAATDTEISQRNSHYIFSELYKMLGISLVGASVTRGRWQVPHLNAIAEFTIMNANRSLQPPSNPQWDLYTKFPIPMPLEEEVQVQVSNNLGAATEQENAIIQLGTDDWNINLPPADPANPYPLIARATFTVTPTINAWSGGQTLSFSQSLRGGVYAVFGGVVQGTNAVAWRLIFPRNKMYRGRRLRPGGLIQNAIGDVVNQQVDPWVAGWGVHGLFHTFELPTIEVFGTTAGSITYQAFLWMLYLGQDRAILDNFVRQGT